jgi:hypothetical protein
MEKVLVLADYDVSLHLDMDSQLHASKSHRDLVTTSTTISDPTFQIASNFELKN